MISLSARRRREVREVRDRSSQHKQGNNEVDTSQPPKHYIQFHSGSFIAPPLRPTGTRSIGNTNNYRTQGRPHGVQWSRIVRQYTVKYTNSDGAGAHY